MLLRAGAALQHFHDTGDKYPLVVKLGTITPHGADVYSYAADENDLVLDPQLEAHLRHWGIDMATMEKSAKTMSELQARPPRAPCRHPCLRAPCRHPCLRAAGICAALPAARAVGSCVRSRWPATQQQHRQPVANQARVECLGRALQTPRSAQT